MIYPTTDKTKCDIKDCKNNAEFYLLAKGRSGKFFLCKDCLEKLYKSLLTHRTPKSPKNTIKKIIDEKEKNY